MYLFSSDFSSRLILLYGPSLSVRGFDPEDLASWLERLGATLLSVRPGRALLDVERDGELVTRFAHELRVSPHCRFRGDNKVDSTMHRT